ncbi:ABC transporter ATP-binding protein [Lawsonibacter sp. LCP25S3_G6]|uniref:ABC transporter ATP-binding protein n=1 Tax=unclassified Lawsonibacter TaxID=2617946 RepID=UPI003F94C301
MSESNVLLKVENVKKWFPVRRGIFSKVTEYVKAVDGVSLEVHAGHTLGIVGESGCGKSTLARVIMGLIPPTEGVVYFEGQDMTHADRATIHRMRRDIQIIFQDPYASLNPRQRVSSILTEPYKIHHLGTQQQAMDRARELLDLVGLPQDSMRKFPHEFSGGQRQRLCIARALAVNPKLIVCDECVSALDVSIQAQIINLLTRLQKQLGIALIFVSHDLRVVEHISSHVAVMYLGRMVEYAEKSQLFAAPAHPYTKALLSAVPQADPTIKKERIILQGDLPSPIHVPSGCPFHPRCFSARPECSQQVPETQELCGGHLCSCLYPEH